MDVRTPLLRDHAKEEPLSSEGSSAILAGVDVQFLSNFRRLIAALQPWGALLLVAVSLVETIIGAQVGKVNGFFYRVLVDKDEAGFKAVLLGGALAFTAATIAKSSKSFLTEYFSLRWRIHLTEKLQNDYCSGDRFYSIEGLIDNPDQRIIQDAAEFCAAFGSVVTVFIAAPFKVAFYTWWMVSIMSWKPVGAVYAFFVVALPLQRYIAAVEAFDARPFPQLQYWKGQSVAVPYCQ